MPNHTYTRHVGPELYEKVNTAFNAFWDVWEAVDLGHKSDLPADLVARVMDELSCLQVMADDLYWRGVRPKKEANDGQGR